MARIGSSSGSSSGSTSPGGSNTDIQYNNGGTFGGSNNFTFDGSNTYVPNGVENAVDFIWSRNITVNITVPNKTTMINSNPLITSTITLLGDAEFILI